MPRMCQQGSTLNTKSFPDSTMVVVSCWASIKQIECKSWIEFDQNLSTLEFIQKIENVGSSELEVGSSSKSTLLNGIFGFTVSWKSTITNFWTNLKKLIFAQTPLLPGSRRSPTISLTLAHFPDIIENLSWIFPTILPIWIGKKFEMTCALTCGAKKVDLGQIRCSGGTK